VSGLADPQVTLAAIATATERVRFGPMVTPLARRRPVKVARETATLDRLSGGRLTLGVGLGSDRFASEFSVTGEELDDRRRGRMLDESLEILTSPGRARRCTTGASATRSPACGSCRRRCSGRACPSGSPGTPGTRSRCAGRPATRACSRSASTTPTSSPTWSPRSPRCARRRARTPPSPTVVVALPPGSDPAPYAAVGATGWLVELPWVPVSVDQVRGVIRDGTATPRASARAYPVSLIGRWPDMGVHAPSARASIRTRHAPVVDHGALTSGHR
jgi:alkanesulfonate monooxygenase SsuD/methylene tetrahydromethanopterin reductase-like flavin-dependent oxidoreductase (luciferase family)